MPDFNEIFKGLEDQIISLAENTVSDFKDQAIQDARQLLADMKSDLVRWTGLLAEGKIKVNEFEWLVNSDKELVKMKGLENAGLAAARASAFGLGVLNLIVDTAIKKVVGNVGG